jgi:hypothetical protein
MIEARYKGNNLNFYFGYIDVKRDGYNLQNIYLVEKPWHNCQGFFVMRIG